MTASTLFSKARTAPAPVLVQTDLQRLTGWMSRGRQERFLVETLVTPEMAAALLSHNPQNRVVNQAAMLDYAAAMRRGEWHLNGQNIIIADSGELNDGQHRLSAVVEAGIPVAMGLQFGVSRDSRSTLDVGRKRSLGDHLAMAGYQNTNAVAAVVRLAWCYDAGIYSLSGNPSVEQAFQYLEIYPNVGAFISRAIGVGSEFKTSSAQFAFAAFVCSRINEQVARELLDRVHDGLGIAASNMPAARVRERLLQHVGGRVPLRRHEASAIFIKAFNATLHGRRMRSLSWTPTGPQAEDFPLAVD